MDSADESRRLSRAVGDAKGKGKTAMTMDLPFFVGLVVVGATLLYFCFRPGIRLPEEKGLIPLFTERCSATTSAGIGVRFGTNMPTCRITLYEHGIVIGIGKPIWIKYSDVEWVQYRQSWWSRWVKVALRDSKLVARFNVRSPAKIADILRERGVRAVAA